MTQLGTYGFDDERVLRDAITSIAPRVSAGTVALLLTLLEAINNDVEEIDGGNRKAATNNHRAAVGGTAAALEPSGSATDAGTDADARAGEGGLILVPDSISPMLGWRSWDVDKGLVSPHDPEFPWRPGKPARARCDVPKRRHAAASCSCPLEPPPAANCTCGIYAARSLELLHRDYRKRDHSQVIGRVALWGKVIEHDGGWRGEYAYPQAFFIHPGQEDLRAELAKYEVPILSTADLPPGALPEPDPERPYWFELPIPDAPGIPADVAAKLVVGSELEPELIAAGMSKPHATRFVWAARRHGAQRLGQLLALSSDELLHMSGIGRGAVDWFRTWRIAHDFGDYPTQDARPIPEPT
jgi:hypothetical protein